MHNPNYHTTHLLEELRGSILPYIHKKSAKDAHELVRLMRCIKDAKKFVMPNDGLLFEDTEFGRYTPLLKLPFDHVVLEYDFSTTVQLNEDLSETRVQRLRGACVLYAQQYRVNGKDGVLGTVISKFHGEWNILPMAVFIPNETDVETLRSEKTASLVPFFEETILKEWMEHLRMNDDQTAKYASALLIREIMPLLQFCAALNCQNVRTERQPAPKFINRKRAEKGKLPLFEYHVLTVDATHRTAHGEPQGGTHASPREHIRRGHIRHYKSGLNLWINQMIVGNKELGRIDKDYRLKGDKGYGAQT